MLNLNSFCTLLAALVFTKWRCLGEYQLSEINTAWGGLPRTSNFQWIELKTLMPPEEEQGLRQISTQLLASADRSVIIHDELRRRRRMHLPFLQGPIISAVQLVIYNGEDKCVHTIVELTGLELLVHEFMIVGTVNGIHPANAIIVPWNSSRVTSVSHGTDHSGFLATHWGYESVAVLYQGPLHLLSKLRLSMHCRGHDANVLSDFIIDAAFYSLSKSPNHEIEQCILSHPALHHSIVNFSRFGRLDTTWCYCEYPDVNTNRLNSGLWRNCVPTPKFPNNCKSSTVPCRSKAVCLASQTVSRLNPINFREITKRSPPPVCSSGSKRKSWTEIEVIAFNDETLRSGGAENNQPKRQKIEAVRFSDSESGQIQQVTVDDVIDNFIPEAMRSIFSMTSAMNKHSEEWKTFFTPANKHLTEDMFLEPDSILENGYRYFWLEGVYSRENGYRIRCHLCSTYWDQFNKEASTQTKGKLVQLEGYNSNQRKFNKLHIVRHNNNVDHKRIFNWRAESWNARVLSNNKEAQQVAIFAERGDNIGIERLFRTIYFGAKKNIPSTTIGELIELQQLNSVAFHHWERKRTAITNYMYGIAEDLDTGMRNYILKVQPLCAVSVDGWRNTFGVEHLLISMRFLYRGLLQTWFIRSVPLIREDAETTFQAMMSGLTTGLGEPPTENELIKNWLQKSIVGFASDGAVVMVGVRNGVVAKLRSFVSTRRLFTIHCMAHKLELVMNDAITSEDNAIDKLEHCMRFMHKMHVKGGGGFAAYKALGLAFDPPIRVRRMRSLKGIRWAAIVGSSLQTVIKDYRVIKQWLTTSSSIKKELSYLFSHEGAFWLYSSEELFAVVSALSKCLQNRSGQVYTIGSTLTKFMKSLHAFKNAEYMPNALTLSEDKALHVQTNDGGEEIVLAPVDDGIQSLEEARSAFQLYVQEVIQAFENRFPVEDRELLGSVSALDFSLWPTDFSEMSSFGNEGIELLASIAFPNEAGSEDPSPLAAAAIGEWNVFKSEFAELGSLDFIKKMPVTEVWARILSGENNNDGNEKLLCPTIGPHLVKVIECGLVLPVSSAENERLAHALSRIDTGATGIGAEISNARLFLQVNGPKWQNFNARAYGKRFSSKVRFRQPIIEDIFADDADELRGSPDFSEMLSDHYLL